MYDAEGQTERDLVVATDDEGNELELEVLGYFFYNGEEYAIVTPAEEMSGSAAETNAGSGAEGETAGCFVMKVVSGTDEDGEATDEFLPIEDETLQSRLMEIASTRLNPEDT